MFSDKYIDQENNDKFREIIFEFLKQPECDNLVYSEHSDGDVRNNFPYNFIVRFTKYIFCKLQ